jgi:hypothetical protein
MHTLDETALASTSVANAELDWGIGVVQSSIVDGSGLLGSAERDQQSAETAAILLSRFTILMLPRQNDQKSA